METTQASDARLAARKEIEQIVPADARERSDRRDALAWIDSGAPIWRVAKPDVPPKHLVSYFALLDERSVLLVDHRNARLWLPAGGHVEAGEHPRETVRREMLEELGVEPSSVGPATMITCSTTVGVTAGHQDVSLWYAIRADRNRPLRFDTAEFEAIRWFGFENIALARSDPNVARFIRKSRGSTRPIGQSDAGAQVARVDRSGDEARRLSVRTRPARPRTLFGGRSPFENRAPRHPQGLPGELGSRCGALVSPGGFRSEPTSASRHRRAEWRGGLTTLRVEPSCSKVRGFATERSPYCIVTYFFPLRPVASRAAGRRSAERPRSRPAANGRQAGGAEPSRYDFSHER